MDRESKALNAFGNEAYVQYMCKIRSNVKDWMLFEKLKMSLYGMHSP